MPSTSVDMSKPNYSKSLYETTERSNDNAMGYGKGSGPTMTPLIEQDSYDGVFPDASQQPSIHNQTHYNSKQPYTGSDMISQSFVIS